MTNLSVLRQSRWAARIAELRQANAEAAPLVAEKVKAQRARAREEIKEEAAIRTNPQRMERLRAVATDARSAEIMKLHTQRASLREIGERYDLSRERVRQIIKAVKMWNRVNG